MTGGQTRRYDELSKTKSGIRNRLWHQGSRFRSRSGYIERREEKPTATEQAVRMAVEAKELENLADRARRLREEVEREYLDAIDEQRASPSDGRLGLATLGWGNAVLRAKALERTANARAKEAARRADAELEAAERERWMKNR